MTVRILGCPLRCPVIALLKILSVSVRLRVLLIWTVLRRWSAGVACVKRVVSVWSVVPTGRSPALIVRSKSVRRMIAAA